MSTPTRSEPPSKSADRAGFDGRALERALRDRVDGEVRFDVGSRAAYSTDASNFRQGPIGVVVPRSVDAAVTAVAVCRRHDVPVLSRGGGTSLAGQCTNTAVVLDWSKYCHRLVSVDPDARTCIVEPGIVLDELNRQLGVHGLRYGPEPATHPNCTLGGMIGNNSCGATAQRTGKVVDNIARLEVLLYDGTRFWCGETSDEDYAEIERHGDRRASVYRQLRRLRDQYADEIRRRYPDIPRRVSGYNLDSLLPERRFDVAGALVGSESTLVTVLRAELELVPVVKERTLVVLGFRDIMAAADAVPAVLPHPPIAVEGVDNRLIHDEHVKYINQRALQELPAGTGFLMVQFGADSHEGADAAAQRLLDALHESDHEPTSPSSTSRPSRTSSGRSGRRDSVSPHTFRATATRSKAGRTPPSLPIGSATTRGTWRSSKSNSAMPKPQRPASTATWGKAACTPVSLSTCRRRMGSPPIAASWNAPLGLVASYGGSFSGEHGDGQSRGELLPRMFGEQIVRAFGELKAIFDPQDRMNPGKVVAPYRLDQNLRLGGRWSPADVGGLHVAYPHDGGLFVDAANRCVGVGKCRQLQHPNGAVMCPSYQATREEEHSTRGRARLLFEMLHGHGDGSVRDGWRSTAVRDALDLCLACKGCRADCPVNVDMATYKAEFLAHHYASRLRPRSHCALGWLPVLAVAIGRTRAAAAVNAATHAPVLPGLLTRMAGLESREIALFAGETLQRWWARRPAALRGPNGTVLLWPDTFTNSFHPHIGQAAVQLLEAAGWQVDIPREPLCCGLTWISTGQLATAKRLLRRTSARLVDHIRTGGRVVGLEPGCTAVFRSDAPELLPDDHDIARLRDQTLTLAELLVDHTPGWVPPRIPGELRALAQVHCHQHAIMGWEKDHQLLTAAGVSVERLDSGCCGLAGNFGFERGHLDVSKACAEQVLLPAVRDADDGTVLLADGFSCRTQIHELAGCGREAVHLAELLAASFGQVTSPVECALARRPAEPPSWARGTAAVASAVAGGSLAGWLAHTLFRYRR